mmetsp:Transcript_35794/g.80543  ORF Transcript_35794/g.80543 Transcript_35794/m.80543 type:complete len:313 (+) Transcript_35794:735-1673(+)
MTISGGVGGWLEVAGERRWFGGDGEVLIFNVGFDHSAGNAGTHFRWVVSLAVSHPEYEMLFPALGVKELTTPMTPEVCRGVAFDIHADALILAARAGASVPFPGNAVVGGCTRSRMMRLDELAQVCFRSAHGRCGLHRSAGDPAAAASQSGCPQGSGDSQCEVVGGDVPDSVNCEAPRVVFGAAWEADLAAVRESWSSGVILVGFPMQLVAQLAQLATVAMVVAPMKMCIHDTEGFDDLTVFNRTWIGSGLSAWDQACLEAVAVQFDMTQENVFACVCLSLDRRLLGMKGMQRPVCLVDEVALSFLIAEMRK